MSEEINSRLKNIEHLLQIILKKETAPEEDKDMIDIKEASEISGLSTASLYNYISNGKLNIPYVKTGTKISFRREDVVRWNAERSYKVIRRHNQKIKI